MSLLRRRTFATPSTHQWTASDRQWSYCRHCGWLVSQFAMSGEDSSYTRWEHNVDGFETCLKPRKHPLPEAP